MRMALAGCTVIVIRHTIGASEKQYAKSEGDLKKILDSFRC